MKPTSREHCSWLQQSRCHAVIEYWMIFFAAYTTAYSQCISIAPSDGDLDPHLVLGSLGPHEAAPKRHLDRFSCFVRYIHMTNTDRQCSEFDDETLFSIWQSYGQLPMLFCTTLYVVIMRSVFCSVKRCVLSSQRCWMEQGNTTPYFVVTCTKRGACAVLLTKLCKWRDGFY